LFKIFYSQALSIDGIFNHYTSIPVCTHSRQHIQQLIAFYDKEDLFRLYNHELSKELGTFYDDEIFVHAVPT
jgi:hypothetical protein